MLGVSRSTIYRLINGNQLGTRQIGRRTYIPTSDTGQILLVEAKAHIPEMCSPGSQAGKKSRRLIQTSLFEVSSDLMARAGHAPWDQFFYQFANRIAHLWWLRRHDVDACLVMVNFVGDRQMRGPATSAEWAATYTDAMHVLGLSANHPLSGNILHIHPDVAHRSQGTSNE